MQDGGINKSRGIYLCTDSFTVSDTTRLATYLSDYYNLKCTMPKAPGKLGKKGHRRIYISATSILLVQSLVKNFMVPSMLYKIGL